MSHFFDVREDVFELIAIADLNSQFNHCRLTLKGFNLGIPHIDAVIA